jgi:hypothetical protein
MAEQILGSPVLSGHGQFECFRRKFTIADGIINIHIHKLTFAAGFWTRDIDTFLSFCFVVETKAVFRNDLSDNYAWLF